MSYSSSFTESQTFTITQARLIAAKVHADLKRIQRLYDHPSDLQIQQFVDEIAVMLVGGYINSVWYGFYKNGSFIPPSVFYEADTNFGLDSEGDDPGGILPAQDVTGAKFHSYMYRTQAWWDLGLDDRVFIESKSGVYRTAGVNPGMSGNLTQDRIYAAGGVALNRSSLKGY